MKNIIRIGKISSIKPKDGTVRVAYSDRNDAVTMDIPLFSFEYKMPKVGDQVIVLHLENGSEAAVVLGRVWSKVNVPPENGEKLYRKDLGQTVGKAVIRYNEETDTLDIKCPGGTLNIEAKTVNITGTTVNITGTSGDVKVNGISLTQHTHNAPALGGETSKPN